MRWDLPHWCEISKCGVPLGWCEICPLMWESARARSMLDFNQHLYTEPHLHFYPHCRCSLFQKAVATLAHLLTASKTRPKTAPEDPNLAPREPLLARYQRKKSWIKKHQRRGIGTWYFFRTPILTWKEEKQDQQELVRKISIVFVYFLKRFGNDSQIQSVPMIVIPGSSRYMKFLPKNTNKNQPEKAEILHTVPTRSTNVYPWWHLNFWDPWFSQFVFCISSSRTSTLRPWCGVVAARDLARVGMWMRCRWQQLSQEGYGGWSIAPFWIVLCLGSNPSLPALHQSSLSWFRFVKGWDFRFRHRRQPMALNKPLPMKWITRRVRRFTRRPGRAVRFVGERWVGKNLTTFFAAIKHFWYQWWTLKRRRFRFFAEKSCGKEKVTERHAGCFVSLLWNQENASKPMENSRFLISWN